jgi:hypothetical protein
MLSMVLIESVSAQEPTTMRRLPRAKKIVTPISSQQRAVLRLQRDNVEIVEAKPTFERVSAVELGVVSAAMEGVRINEVYTLSGPAMVAAPEFSPVVFPAMMRYHEGDNFFRGTIDILLFDAHSTVPTPLIEPMTFVLNSNIDNVAPTNVTFHRTMETITVHVEDWDPMNPAELRLCTPMHPEGIPIPVTVESAMVFETESRTVQGWGVESTKITLMLRGAREGDELHVTLETTDGEIEPSEVVLTATGPTSVTIRSAGLGEATISAIARGHKTQRLAMIYSFPLAFFLSGLLGGLVGAIGSWFLRKNDADCAKPVAFIVGWTLFGFAAAAIWLALGVNLAGIEVRAFTSFNEIAVFAFGALVPLSWCVFLKLKSRLKPDTP